MTFVPRAGLLPALCFILSTSAIGTAAAGSPPAASGASEPGGGPPKTHTLYVGADFAIEWEGQLRPVMDVQGSAFVVSVNGKPVVVTSHKTDLRIKMDNALKVTSTSATIANFATERFYTAARDPHHKLEEAINMADVAAQSMDAGVVDILHSQMQHLQAEATSAQIGAIESSAFAARSELNSVPDAITQVDVELARELFDAFSLTFEVSAPQPLPKPYIVVVTRYREKPERPDTSRIWIYAQALPRVDTNPAKVQVLRGGFPPGYKLEDVQVHLYDQGAEIATNIAPKRVAITADEAFQLFIVSYIEHHRGATLRPAPANTASLAGLRQRLPAEKLSREFFVKVGKDGKPVGAYADEACVEKITDSDLEASALALRFIPALNSGKPVEAVAPVRLDQLAL